MNDGCIVVSNLPTKGEPIEGGAIVDSAVPLATGPRDHPPRP